MPIETENPEYTECLPKWTLVRKCVAGAQAVRREGTVFLPDPDPNVLDKDVRYNPYRKRAQFLNVTARTRNAMVGMAFRRPPEYDLTGIEYIEENANGSGTNLEQLAKVVVGDLLEVGRIGLLSDYPSAEQGMSKEQISRLGLKATIKLYTAENIINWKTTVINGESVLSLVNLMETYELKHDEYSQETEKQFRVLKLVDGIYTQELYRDDILIESFQPRANGSTLKYIPMVIAILLITLAIRLP